MRCTWAGESSCGARSRRSRPRVGPSASKHPGTPRHRPPAVPPIRSGGSSKVGGNLGSASLAMGRMLGNDILRLCHDHRAILEQPVGAGRARGSSGEPGTGEDDAAHLSRKAGADQRTGAIGRFHHHQPEPQAGHQPVAARKVARPPAPSRTAFPKTRAARSAISSGKPDIFRRVGAVEPARHHGHRAGVDAGRYGLRRRSRAPGRRRWNSPPLPDPWPQHAGHLDPTQRGVGVRRTKCRSPSSGGQK